MSFADLHTVSAPRPDPNMAKRILRAKTDQAVRKTSAQAASEEELRVLGKMLSEHTGSIDVFVKEHRLTSTQAIFVLGAAVGRLMEMV